MRRQAKKLIAEIMKRYADTVESLCIAVGEYVTEATAEVVECVRYCGGYLLTGLAVVLAWLLLAATMPAWYLPYKYFTRNYAMSRDDTGKRTPGRRQQEGHEKGQAAEGQESGKEI